VKAIFYNNILEIWRSFKSNLKIINIILIGILLTNCDRSNKLLKIGFWNVENLFDLENNPIKNDDEFSIGGEKRMTQEILDMKIDHLVEVLSDLDADVLGLCEVENRKVLELLNKRFLEKNYSIVHFESPDLRGIDTALLYDSDKFAVVDSFPIEIYIQGGDPTRDILFVKGKFQKKELHIFVNHWPSNYSGLERGIRRRSVAAKTLRIALDDILKNDENANIFLMGDFNEDPLGTAVRDVLNSSINSEEVVENVNQLWNPMAQFMGVENGGTYKYRGIDNVIDQFIISKGLINKNGLELKSGTVKVLNRDKYRQQSGDFAGYPFRFWVGNTLLGGYSDHMAIHCNLYLE